MHTLYDWAGTHGADRCVLQVSVTNDRALALYAGLGFREHHRYRYWVPCEDRAPVEMGTGGNGH